MFVEADRVPHKDIFIARHESAPTMSGGDHRGGAERLGKRRGGLPLDHDLALSRFYLCSLGNAQ
jgi:hypothetical protein